MQIKENPAAVELHSMNRVISRERRGKFWMNKFVSALVLPLAAIAAMASAAHSAILAPSASVTSAPTGIVITGTLLDSVTSSFTAAGGSPFIGAVTSQVYQETGGNGFNGLTFVYQVTNNPGSNVIGFSSFDGFTGYIADVYQSTAAGNTAFSSAARSSGAGSTITFNFYDPAFPQALTTGITAGNSSYLLIARTNATSYQFNTGQSNNFFSSSNAFTTLSPVVPEPGMIAFAMTSGMGLLGMGIRARRRRGTPGLEA